MDNTRYVKLLKGLSKKDSTAAGGKGARLGEMIKAGLPVPDGFVLLACSYNSFTAANNISSKIEELLQGFDNDDYEKAEQISYKIRQLFRQGEIPRDVAVQIDRAYAQIGSTEVAVRSSAADEDLPENSFAGQYETYLNVKGKDDLYTHIKKCWASLWNTRALYYRLKQNTGSMELNQGVVVQRLIDAEKSGILFTANPLNGRRDQLLLNASWGLGEAIVGGDVTPDQWIVDRKNKHIVKENIAAKEVMTVRKTAGVELVDVPLEKREQSTLDHGEVIKLIELGVKVEECFGFPQDIEWAFCEGEFFLVQSRPVTSLYPMPEPEDIGKGLRIYINFLLSNQAAHEPLTPIGEDIWKKVYINIIFNRRNRRKPVTLIKSAAGRLFVDVTDLYRFERWWDKLRNNPSDMDPVTTRAMLQVLKRNKTELKKQGRPLVALIPGMIARINPGILKLIFTSFPKVMYGLVFPPEKAAAKAFEYGNKQIQAVRRKREELQTRQEKLRFIQEQATAFFYFVPLQVLYYGAVSFTFIDKARRIISKYMDDISELNKVEKSVPHCVTTEMGMEMLQAAKNLDRAGEQPGPEHPVVKEFLMKYGDRSCQEVDLGVPRWKENPGYVVGLIKSYMDNKSYEEGIEKFYQGMEEAERAIENITAQLKEKGAHRNAKKVEKLLKKFRKMFGIRELPKFILTKAVSLFREILMEIGEELEAEGRIVSREDIFFVTFKDIESGEKLQELVKQNRSRYQRELKRDHVPRVMTSTGETVFSEYEDDSKNGYGGIPVSPGVYEGPVKVLKRPEEGYRLQKGDILVTTAANPAWTPLFLRIGGLIMETGGPISHGSVVAREYGIPAVAGLREATIRLKDGQRVRLNGETGKVEILSPL